MTERDTSIAGTDVSDIDLANAAQLIRNDLVDVEVDTQATGLSAGFRRTTGAVTAAVILGSVGAVVSNGLGDSEIAEANFETAVPAGGTLRVNVPEAVGGGTVAGQLTVAGVEERGFVTAFACDEGLPRDSAGNIAQSDLNYDGTVQPVASNRLIVEADMDGDICFYTLREADMVIDISKKLPTAESFANQRTDTRDGQGTIEGPRDCGHPEIAQSCTREERNEAICGVGMVGVGWIDLNQNGVFDREDSYTCSPTS